MSVANPSQGSSLHHQRIDLLWWTVGGVGFGTVKRKPFIPKDRNLCAHSVPDVWTVEPSPRVHSRCSPRCVQRLQAKTSSGVKRLGQANVWQHWNLFILSEKSLVLSRRKTEYLLSCVKRLRAFNGHPRQPSRPTLGPSHLLFSKPPPMHHALRL